MEGIHKDQMSNSFPLFIGNLLGKLFWVILKAGAVSDQKKNEPLEGHRQDANHNGLDEKDTSKSNEMGMKGEDIADADTVTAFVETNFVVFVESVLNSAAKDVHKDKSVFRFFTLQPL